MIILENTDEWRICSYCNGGAYSFEHKPTGNVGHVQGDDATQWRDEYERVSVMYMTPGNAIHNQTWNECLTLLCGDYDAS